MLMCGFRLSSTRLVVAVGEDEVIGEAISEPVSCEDCLLCVNRVRTIDIERRHMHSFSSSCFGKLSHSFTIMLLLSQRRELLRSKLLQSCLLN